ncbi:MAG: organic solvent tolerance protein OstA [Selenomonas sp.]|jgi:lipopolysaccharide export system protein LptA|nr:organic solvent tolerance protein OstA [Selenomonas sp.]MCI7331912.1 organic solvent tolerance protein OstA [Selenomonadaceae bacterium]MDD7056486.1 LptA/OstA family protein [Selenomonadaceae bacterium]HBT78898.1 organic solvent tolerance protein OstA [Selenomonas sp.]
MRKWQGKKVMVALSVAIACTMGTLYAAGSSALDADTVEYDMGTGEITASGNVLMKHDGARIAGSQARYNMKSQQGRVTGSVIAEKDDMRLSCAELTVDGPGHYLASGNVQGQQGDKSFSGAQVDYYPDKQYVSMTSGGTLASSEGTFTADNLQGWLQEAHYVGTGNAHIVSPPRDLEAGGNQFDYYGQGSGQAVLTGNAWAVQGNNTMHSQRLTIYLASDGSAKVQ